MQSHVKRAAVMGALFGSVLTLGVVAAATGSVGCGNKSSASPDDKSAAAGSKPRLTGPDAEPVAVIDGTVITVADFRDRLNKQSPYIRARYTSLERKKEFLENLIRFEVLAKEADKRGLGEDPEVVRTMKQVMIQKLMQDEFDNRVKIEDITDAEMKAFYDSHNSEYNQPEQVRVSALVVKRDSKLAARLADEIKGPKGQDNKAFRDMVMQFSEDEASKVRGGDLRYFDETTQEVPKDVVKASFALEKVGDVAGPIKTEQGFYIIKQTGRRKALTRTFEEVKRQIQNRLYREKRTNVMEAFVENLRKTAKVQLFDERIAHIQVDMTGSLGSDTIPDPSGGFPGQPQAPAPTGVGMMGAPPAGQAPAGATPDAPAAAGINNTPAGSLPVPPMGPRGTPPPIAPGHHPGLPDPRVKPATPKKPAPHDEGPAG